MTTPQTPQAPQTEPHGEIVAQDVPRVSRQRSYEHRAAEIAAWLELTRTFRAGDWPRRTVCTEWDVADIVGHLIGQAEDVIRPWAFPLRQLRAHRRYPDADWLDAHMMVQADEHRGTPPGQLIALFDRRWSKATRAILRMPKPVRAISMTMDFVPDPEFRRMSLGYVHDVLLARDLWMHRDDVCQALGRSFDAGPYVTELIDQVMLDVVVGGFWSGPPIVLELTGPGGGRYRLGDGHPVGTASTDAVGYMRTLSGRDDNPVVTGDPVAVEAVARTRMPF
jgi:uncharacterized protein (TIGR03083 family)